jgi:hypothetical protein
MFDVLGATRTHLCWRLTRRDNLYGNVRRLCRFVREFSVWPDQTSVPPIDNDVRHRWRDALVRPDDAELWVGLGQSACTRSPESK